MRVFQRLRLGRAFGYFAATLIAMIVALAAAVGPAAAASCPAKCAYTSCVGLTTSSGTVAPGSSVTVNGTGWEPNSTVTLNVCNIETVTAHTNSQGDFSQVVNIPDTAAAQNCVISASGDNGCAKTTSITTTVVITTSSTVPPASTGEPWASWLYFSLIAMTGLLGLIMLLTAWRRRQSPLIS
ncbi:MAG TPA: hypothetical protein VGP46_04935 [Acidimicrobiales bacterium]|nr:hypothetical protein [Acidimicrobiales bacterium]